MASTAKRTKADPKGAGAKVLRTGLRKLRDEYVKCRDIRHKWEISQDFHVVPFSWAGRKIEAVRRVLTCERCEATREQLFLNGRYGLEKLTDRATRPKDYAISGVPRGVKQQAIVQQESYRRALEKATGAAKGARATAER